MAFPEVSGVYAARLHSASSRVRGGVRSVCRAPAQALGPPCWGRGSQPAGDPRRAAPCCACWVFQTQTTLTHTGASRMRPRANGLGVTVFTGMKAAPLLPARWHREGGSRWGRPWGSLRLLDGWGWTPETCASCWGCMGAAGGRREVRPGCRQARCPVCAGGCPTDAHMHAA